MLQFYAFLAEFPLESVSTTSYYGSIPNPDQIKTVPHIVEQW